VSDPRVKAVEGFQNLEGRRTVYVHVERAPIRAFYLDDIPAVRDALAPFDERVQGPGLWKVDENGEGDVCTFWFRDEDDPTPVQYDVRPRSGPTDLPSWQRWRAVLAGLGLEDVG
jgi:hypothetical protein